MAGSCAIRDASVFGASPGGMTSRNASYLFRQVKKGGIRSSSSSFFDICAMSERSEKAFFGTNMPFFFVSKMHFRCDFPTGFAPWPANGGARHIDGPLHRPHVGLLHLRGRVAGSAPQRAHHIIAELPHRGIVRLHIMFGPE